jgi:sugar phosphate isomerase/epimerase
MTSQKDLALLRREFLRRGSIGLAAACSPLVALAAKKKVPVALQLYSVRHDCEKDLPGTLTAVADIGYKAVEFAGYYGRTAKELRGMLDERNLKCCGTHIGLETMLADKLAGTIEFNKTTGNPNLIVPWLDPDKHKTKQAWLDTARLFNELSDKVKPHGMRVGYHNHVHEFHPIDGELPWDLFFGNTKKEVIMQFDTGNALEGGGEAAPFIKRYPGRAVSVHVKAFSKSNPKALIGDDEINWKELFHLLETVGGTEWYIVEYESDAYPPVESVRRCFENMKKMGKV